MALELLFGTIGQRFVKRTPFGQTDVFKCFAQRVFVEFFGANEVHTGDVGALFNNQHQHLAVDFNANIFEQTQGIQATNGSSAFFVGVLLAHAQWNGCKHSAWFDALQALHPNITNLKRIDGECIEAHQRSQHQAACLCVNGLTEK